MMRLTAPVVLPCDERCTVLRDAVVDVDDAGRIMHVGPSPGAPAAPGAELALTGILLPGLVNAHAHTAMTTLRGLGGDLLLMRWLTEVIWPAEARLTDRETEVLRQVATGRTARQIADALVISHRTVENHVQSTLRKLQLHNRVELARYAIEHGLLDQ